MNKIKLKKVIDRLITEDIELASVKLHEYLNTTISNILEMDENEKCSCSSNDDLDDDDLDDDDFDDDDSDDSDDDSDDDDDE